MNFKNKTTQYNRFRCRLINTLSACFGNILQILLVLFLFSLPCFSADSKDSLSADENPSQMVVDKEVYITSDYLEYSETDGYLIAKGSVTVNWSDKYIKADKVEFYTRRQLVSAEGNVAITEASQVITGDKALYDIANSTGSIENAGGYSHPWLFKMKYAVKRGEKEYYAKGYSTTNCELEKPHWYIKGKSAVISIGKRVTIYNAVVLYTRNSSVLFSYIYKQVWVKPNISLK